MGDEEPHPTRFATLCLRDLSPRASRGTPVLIEAPYAGHSATIADYSSAAKSRAGGSTIKDVWQNGFRPTTP